MNLTEATMLALQGKLNLEEDKEIISSKKRLMKKESINVSIDDNGAAVVDTPEATVIITDPVSKVDCIPEETIDIVEIPEEVIEDVIEDNIENENEEEIIEVPIEGDKTIVPEEDIDSEKIDEIIEDTKDEIIDTEEKIEDEEVIEESKKITESDATNDFIKEFGELLKKYTRSGIEKLELSEDTNTVTITFNSGATKTVDITADSNIAAIHDIMKKVESKDIKEEGFAKDGCTIFSLKIDCCNDAFGFNTETEEQNTEDMNIEIARILRDIASKVEEDKIGNDESILDINGNIVGKCGFGYEGVLDSFTESKKVEENVEIKIAEDGKEIEVKTDENENVELVDETNDEKESVEDDKIETIEDEKEIEEISNEDEDEEVIEDEIKDFDIESFEESLKTYYKNNTKLFKELKIDEIKDNNNTLKIEAKLTNKLGRTKDIKLECNPIRFGNCVTKYNVKTSNSLLESVDTTPLYMMTKTIDNKIICFDLNNKKVK